MAHERNKIVRDADDVVREYYEGPDTEQEGRVADPQETVLDGDERAEHRRGDTARTPTLTGGDVDAGWEYADVDEETVGGANPTPDQDIVDALGEAVGVTYEDNEPLKFDEKLEKRDRARWELDPASADDYQERLQRKEEDR